MPIGLSRKKSGPKKKSKLSAKEAAEGAVAKFEEERDLLYQMREEFEEKFSDANEFLQSILRQEDVAQESINSVIPFVRDARQNIGEFKCQLKKSKPCYDDKTFMTLVTQLKGGGDILMNLIEGGYIKKIALDSSAAAYFAQHPPEARHFQSAWRDSIEMTPSVTPPKL